MRSWQRALASLGLLLALSACSTGLVVPGAAAAIPMCDDVPPIEADAALYRDAPIYVGNEMPADAVAAWAADKPGFEELWIDRRHNGWVTVAFSRDAAARQAELAAAFAGQGVVAVAVPWTMNELEQLQDKVIKLGPPLVFGAGIDVMHGVVDVNVGVLKPDRVRDLASRFAGTRICIEGIDPADAAVEGPQQPAGRSWRLLADEDATGFPYDTGIATDAASLTRLWQEVGLAASVPAVDFETEVAVWFGAVHGSSCPRLRLDDVRYDAERRVLHPVITSLDIGICTADAIGHAYVVAIQRSMLPHGRFVIQLQADSPPPGAMDSEPTIVDADLSIPGSTLTLDQILAPTPTAPNANRVQLGDYLEEGEARQYRFSLACGAEWLGRWDGYEWRTDAQGQQQWVPDSWQAAAGADGTIDVWLTLLVAPSAHIEAKAAGVTLTYLPTHDTPPTCQ